MTDASSAERAAVVAWLREQRDLGLAIAKDAPARSHRERDHVAGSIAVGKAADAIERGEHLTGVDPQEHLARRGW